MNRNCVSAALFAVLILAGLELATVADAAEPSRLRFGTIAPRGSLYHQTLLEMGNAWKQAEAQGSQFTVFTDGSQGGETDIVRRMRIGQLNGALVSAVGLMEIDSSAAALQVMPLMFRSWEEVDAAGQRVRPMLEKRLSDRGYVVLFWGEGGWVRFFSKERAVRPGDFKKLKLFAWSGDPEQIALMKAMNYQPVVLETADIIPGLQTGLINAVPVTAMWALASQIDASAKHMLDIRWVPIVGAAVVTRKAWDGLSPAGREALQRGAARAAADIRAQRVAMDVEAVEAMKKRGLQVHVLTPDVEAEWRELAVSVYPKIRGSQVPADMFDAVQRAVMEHRAANSGERR